MRRRRQFGDFNRHGSMVQLGWLFGGALLLLALGAGGLAYYGSTLQPERYKVEKVLPDAGFPR